MADAVDSRGSKRPADDGAAVDAFRKKLAGGSGGARNSWQNLRHRYFALRHGESEANVAGIIISDPAVGTIRYGLSPAGRKIVASAAKDFLERFVLEGSDLPRRVSIVTSDFKRTRETAEEFLKVLQTGGTLDLDEIRPTPALRERFFGELEAGPNTRYDDVWASDLKDPNSEPCGAESADAVRRRTSQLIDELERDDKERCTFVLVSHGDALQLLQTAFQGKSASEHRSLLHLQPGELRELVVGRSGD